MYTLVPLSPRAAPPLATIRQKSNLTITTRILSVLVAHCVYLYWLWVLTSALCSGAKGAPWSAPRRWFGAPLLTTNVGLPEYDQELGGKTGVMEAQRPAAMRESTEGRGIEERASRSYRWPGRAGC
jgi:hypothetical protein